ncbi:Cloroperoxidase [Rickenella mellea]|uniref:Cloroperoxidase n=1 Tax=Rickenella mellea TaxID=50990 RepID=A0A4Y7Q1L6_9AGAM|nr:Cloroperoxidase [Rickenella mellea]
MSSLSSHQFRPASDDDSRSPCPALNALANHGYLPHNGKNLSIMTLVRAMKSVYNLSTALSLLLAIGGTILCGNWLSLNLHDLALHNRIEHDASLTHEDALHGHKYAPIDVDQSLVSDMLDCSPADDLTLEDLARVRARRDMTLAVPLGGMRATISRAECAQVIIVFGDENGVAPKRVLREWFGEERIPDGWSGPKGTAGIRNTFAKAKEVGQEVARLTRHA